MCMELPGREQRTPQVLTARLIAARGRVRCERGPVACIPKAGPAAFFGAALLRRAAAVARTCVADTKRWYSLRCGPMSSAEQPQPVKPVLHECLPKAGLVYSEKGNLSEVLCKPKILPIKSITLEKLEQMEAAAAKGQPPSTNTLSMDN